MNPEQLESAKKLFFVLLGIDIAITVVVGFNAFSTIGTLKDIQSGVREVDQSLLSSFSFWDEFSSLILLTMIGVGLGLVKWLDSCYRFAKDSLGATGFKNERLTAVGWIIPFFNLFKPYQIINEIYKAGDPTYTTSDGWKKESGSDLLLVWWIFWAVTHLIGIMISKQMLRGTLRDDVTLQQAIDMTGLQAWACVVSVIIAGLWFVVANHLTRRLLERTKVLEQTDGAIEQLAAPNSGVNGFADLSKSEPMRMSAAPRTSVAPAAKPSQLAAQIVETNSRTADVPGERFWSAAIAEFEGPSRRPGLWARAFAEAQGNEPAAKANYLRYRADELQQEHAALLEQGRRDAEAAARAAKLAHLSAERRAYAELPKGVCPNCEAIIPLRADTCPKCEANFTGLAVWKVLPIDERGQVKALRAAYLSGKEPTVDEVIFLAGASSRDSSLVTLSDRFRAQTLLHWAAKFGLQQEASLLIANGANATASNGDGRKPFELTQDLELQGVLRAAAHTNRK